MNGLALATVKSRFTFSSNDANRHEETIKIYAKVVSHILRQYATDAVIARADEKIRNLKQGSSTMWDFFQKIWDLTL